MASYQPRDRRPILDGFRKTAYSTVDWCVDKRIHPNWISYASVGVAALASIMLLVSHQHPWLLLVIPPFAMLRLYFNMLDGMVAVKSAQCSPQGEVINEVPDRISDGMLFVALAHSGLCNTHLAWTIAWGALFVAYLGVVGQAVGAGRQYGGWMSKQNRIIALSLGCWAQFALPAGFGGASVLDVVNALIALGMIQTLVVRWRTMFSNLAADHPGTSPNASPETQKSKLTERDRV